MLSLRRKANVCGELQTPSPESPKLQPKPLPMTPPNKRALVTGGSGDLGSAICRSLAEAGHHVYVHANSGLDRAQALVDELLAAGLSAEPIAFDVADAAACTQATGQMLEAGPIQIVVNNAGIHDDAPMAGMSETQWKRVIDVSLHGFFHVTQPLLLPMARTRWGRVISISSVAKWNST